MLQDFGRRSPQNKKFQGLLAEALEFFAHRYGTQTNYGTAPYAGVEDDGVAAALFAGAVIMLTIRRSPA